MSLVEHRKPWSGLETKPEDARVGLLGIPFDNAVSWRSGARHAPEKLRSISPHLAFYTEEGVRLEPCLKDYGDLESDLDWQRYFAAVQNQASHVIAAHELALFIGGDHSIGIPTFAAFAEHYNNIGYIQFDSHPDLANEFEGHKWSHACTARRHVEDSGLKPEKLAFVGLRSYLDEELEFFEAHPETERFSARQVHQLGVQAVADKLIAQFQDCDAVYFSLDIDGLDPAFAPGTGTPEAGGLSTRECLELLRCLFATLPIRAMDIVELSPPLDYADITSLAALKIIYETLGFMQNKL